MSDAAHYRNVLVPTDGSEEAERAATHAITIASTTDATLHALYVVDDRITMAADAEMRDELEATLVAEGENAVDHLKTFATSASLECVPLLRYGTPSKEILEYATEADIDLIVIGRTGKSPREKLMRMGSVSERVVEGTTVPVLVVRKPVSDD